MNCNTIITLAIIVSFTAGFMFYLVVDTLEDSIDMIKKKRKSD